MLLLKRLRPRSIAKRFHDSIMATQETPALMLTSFEDRELCAAVTQAQAQTDAMRHGWSHIRFAGWRFSVHAIQTMVPA